MDASHGCLCLRVVAALDGVSSFPPALYSSALNVQLDVTCFTSPGENLGPSAKVALTAAFLRARVCPQATECWLAGDTQGW